MQNKVNKRFLDYVQNQISKPREIVLLVELLREVAPQNKKGNGFFHINGKDIFIPEILRDQNLDESLFPYLVDMAKGATLKDFGSKLTIADYERFMVYLNFCMDYLW